MSNYGMFITADDGTLLITPDSPCYELIGEYSPSSRSGNVNTYYVTSTDPPLIFAAVGKGHSAGILSIQGSNGTWTIEVLATKSCTILAFKPLENNSTSGYGMAVYNKDGVLIFDTSRNFLAVNNAGSLDSSSSFARTSTADCVCYTAGPVLAEQSKERRWEDVDGYSYLELADFCVLQTVCDTSIDCGFVTKCSLQTNCGINAFGFFSCSFDNVCTTSYECTNNTTCGLQNVCTPTWNTIIITIWARVERTNWSIKRGTAEVLSAQNLVGFKWLLHKNGYYDTIIFLTSSTAQLGFGTLPAGYLPYPTLYQEVEVYEGELSVNDTFPYTTDTANTGQLVCLTTIRSNYV